MEHSRDTQALTSRPAQTRDLQEQHRCTSGTARWSTSAPLPTSTLSKALSCENRVKWS
jgi:hypothetical protein